MSARNARRWLIRLAAAAALLTSLLMVFPACNTPFIPIPPPSDPTFTPVVVTEPTGGTHTAWETRGAPSEAMASARVVVFNRDLGGGVITTARADGSYVAFPLDGRINDRVEIHYETKEGERSPVICRVLQEGVAQTACP